MLQVKFHIVEKSRRFVRLTNNDLIFDYPCIFCFTRLVRFISVVDYFLLISRKHQLESCCHGKWKRNQLFSKWETEFSDREGEGKVKDYFF